MKVVLFSLLVITSIFFIIPSVYASHSIEDCENVPMDEVIDCVNEAEALHEDSRLDQTSKAMAAYNNQVLLLGVIIALLVAVVAIVFLKFVVLKK